MATNEENVRHWTAAGLREERGKLCEHKESDLMLEGGMWQSDAAGAILVGEWPTLSGSWASRKAGEWRRLRAVLDWVEALLAMEAPAGAGTPTLPAELAAEIAAAAVQKAMEGVTSTLHSLSRTVAALSGGSGGSAAAAGGTTLTDAFAALVEEFVERAAGVGVAMALPAVVVMAEYAEAGGDMGDRLGFVGGVPQLS
eukprot:gene860-1351_t